jgi:hypothetical protein
VKPFIDTNRIEEALPLATIENAIEVIKKDFQELLTDQVSNLEVAAPVINSNGRERKISVEDAISQIRYGVPRS